MDATQHTPHGPELERALGERLVERPGGPVPVRLTEAGMVVNRHAEAITDRLNALRTDLCQRRLESALRSAGVEPNVVFRSGDNATVQALVKAGVGHAIVPQLTIDDRDEGIVVRTLHPAIPPRRVGLIIHRDRYQPPALRAFIEMTGARPRSGQTPTAYRRS